MGYGPIPQKVFQLNPGLSKFSAMVFCISRNVHETLNILFRLYEDICLW